MASQLGSQPYTKRQVPITDTPAGMRGLGGPNGWLSTEFGNIQRALSRATSLTVIADYTATVNDGLILVDATADDVTVTLPDPNRVHDMVVTLKRIDASGNTVTIGGTVDGALNPTLGSQYASVTVWSHVSSAGSGAWYLVGQAP